MGRISDSDLKTIPEHELLEEFAYANWTEVFGGFVASKACALYFYSQWVHNIYMNEIAP